MTTITQRSDAISFTFASLPSVFYKRTIKPHTPVTSVDTASEALAVSMGEKARVDMDYMCELTGKTEEEIFADLKGVIFLNPMYGYGNSTQAKYLMADEYLSGNVREKLAFARRSAQLYPDDYTANVEALERVQPKDLTASEIAVRLGATWLPTEIVEQFMFEFLGTPRYAQWNIKVHFSAYTGEWNIEGKSYDRSNVKAYSTYGTGRINAYKIIEETLNLKDVRIFDYVEDADGKKKAVLNKKETAIAQAKQELIKQGFQDWVWSDPERRERLCILYNEKFNSLRPREYDGSHIVFSGMNPEIELREHQRNAVAHILYGGNTLLAHAVGAGKTFEMVSAAMESKRLGLWSKSLVVGPNHLTEQWASEFLQLYPSANILVATKKDFETKNRKKFCGRIATGDYDAIIIGHSQFEKIPMSIERQRAILEQQLDEVTEGIAELKKNRGDNFSVKQLERTKKAVKQKFASQIMTSKSPVRSCEDIDETALSYAEIKMLATGNPHIKEKMDLDIQVQKLRLLKSSFLSEKYALEDKIIKFYPQEIARRADVIAGLKSDMERVAEHPKPSDETFVGMTVKGAFYSEKADAGNAILEACKAMTNPDPIPLGEYRGFPMELYFEAREYKVRLKGELGYPVTLGTDTFGNITRLDNALEGLPKRLEMNEMELDNIKKQFETAKVDVERPFPQEEELKAKTDRLNELNALLNVDKRENEIVGGEPDEGEEPPEKKPRDLER